MAVIIPKGGGTDFLGNGLVEFLWKAISVIINYRLLSSIQPHDVLHGFCAGRVTGDATLEADLLQQLIAMRETVLRAIFLDMRRAYYALDRERCIYILEGYGVGPRTICILRTYWDRLQMAENVGGRYGSDFQIHSGVTQGDPCHPQSLMWLLILSSNTG